MSRLSRYSKRFSEQVEVLGLLRATKWAIVAGGKAVKRRLYPVPRHIAFEGNLSSDSIDEEVMVPKTGRKVFIFSLIPYYDIGGGQRPAQLTKAFNKMGYAVYYFFGIHSSESKLYHIEVPTAMHLNIDGITASRFSEIVSKDDLVIFDFPYYKFIPFLDIAKDVGAKVIYENIDNWETSLGGEFFEKTSLKSMLRKADVLVGTAKPLVSQLEDYLEEYKIPKKKILYSANTVDSDIFEPRIKHEKPGDLVIGKKTLIYYGSLWGEWFDWKLIDETAKNFPEYEINLIGDDKPVEDRVKVAPGNVHFLGLKKQTDLPGYLEHSDIALIPFKVDKIGEYVSPLKIFEYIAMNKTILSTKLPDIIGYPNTYTGNTPSEWARVLKKIENKPVDSSASKEFTSNNNWFSRASDMIDATFPFSAERTTAKGFYDNISVIVLNYNNRDVIFDCVDDLLRHRGRYGYEVVVVDNQSKDGSYEELKKKYKDKIKLVQNTKNGCSSGRNLGVKSSSRDYILFLDSDQFILHRYWLDSFVDLIQQKDIDVLGWAAGWLKKEVDGFSRTVFDYPYNYMPANVAARCDIDYLGSGGMLLRRGDFNKSQGFDERYDPTCFEDTDLSLSLRDSGFSIYYSPYLGALHIPHQTTKSGTAGHQKMFDEREEYFYKKWEKRNPSLLEDRRHRG